MFTLLTSQGSPYGRKVRLVAALLGIEDKLKIQESSFRDPDDPIHKINPLSKIPALVPDGGAPIFDSRVICGYLCDRFDDGLVIPTDPDARARALTSAALAEGVCDALLLIVNESRFHEGEQISTAWLDHQYRKVRRGLETVVANLDAFAAPGIAAVTLACTLGYIDYRQQLDWRAEFPALQPWLDEFSAAVPAWDETKLPES
jgi:glutathione S-transferase